MSRNSAYILALGWLMVLLGAVGLILTYLVSSSDVASTLTYTSGNCPLAETYYKQSDLTKVEQKQFSTNAIAYDLIGASHQRYRLVIDYSIDSQTRDKLEVKTYLSSSSSLMPLTINYLLNGTISQSDSLKGEGRNYFVSSESLKIDSNSNLLGISIIPKDSCEFSANELLKINKQDEYGKVLSNWKSSSSALANFQGDTLELSPGDNYVAFDDWSYVGKILSQGIEISYFSPKSNKWLDLSTSEPITRPGTAYLIRNTTQAKISVAMPKPFRVPDDLNSSVIEKGWNLVALNSSDKKIKDYQVAINPDQINLISPKLYSLGELVDGGYISEINPIKDAEAVKLDVNKALNEQATGKYWIKLGKEPESKLKIPNLILNVEGMGDSFASRQIPLKISIENKDSVKHQIISATSSDPCQIGVIVRDSKGKTIFDDFSKRACPLWPNLEDLSPGSKKEYNYLWEAPANLKGNYVMDVYFTYSRLAGNKLVKSASITLK